MTDLLRLIRTLVWVSFFAALYQELRKPPEERTWHGKVAGVVPYDFRLPTIERIREAYWNPESETIFTERVLGVGWAINIPTAVRRISEILSQYGDVTARSRGPDSDARPGTGGRAPRRTP
jgi:hypothetical protein